MSSQWEWIVRLLRVFILAPVRVSGDGGSHFARHGRLAVGAAIFTWITIWLLATYLTIFVLDEDDSTSCFYNVVNKTMRMYNTKLVVSTGGVLVFFTNVLCLTTMYRKDLVNMITRNVNLYTKAGGKVQQLSLCTPLKGFFLFVFLSPYVTANIIAVLCNRGSAMLWAAMLTSTIGCFCTMPSISMATVFFNLLYTSEESLTLIHKQLSNLYLSKRPRPFLESTLPETTSRPLPLTVHRLHALRMVHHELVEFMEDVMKEFQTEILVMFLTSFCQNVMLTYSVVFNHKDMFHDTKTFYFVCHSLYSIIKLVSSLWMICAGPTRIKDKQGDLMISTSRLSTILNLPTDIVHEIRIFQLQVRNYTPSFEVFGMFQLSFSLLFRMCASIVSYIVVLLQFAIPPPEMDSFSTTSYPVNVTDD